MPVILRPSSLMAYLDCPRRCAASLFKRDIEAAGYALTTERKNIASIVGTATHSGVALTLTNKMTSGELCAIDDAQAAAYASIKEELDGHGATYDASTPNLNTAVRQAFRMVDAYQRNIAPLIEPVAVEKTFAANVPGEPDYQIKGTLDLSEHETVEDLKTGIKRRQNAAQYGAYSLLRRAHGHAVTRIKETFIPRGRVTAPQPAPIRVDVSIETAETMAHHVIRHIIRDHKEFVSTGNPWAFLPNPSSMLCTEVYCRAWGTKFCTAYKQPEDGK